MEIPSIHFMHSTTLFLANWSDAYQKEMEAEIFHIHDNSFTLPGPHMEKKNESFPIEFYEISKSGLIWIIAYSFVFVIALIGNLLEFRAVFHRIKCRRSPMNMLLLNLCTADIIVVVFVVGVEICWRISIGWYAGNFACKFLQFSRAFGLYLSSFVLICLTLDRYYAVLHPLKVVNASKRVKMLLGFAWIFAAIFATPQCLVFNVRSHPSHSNFTQCTTIGDVAEEVNTILSICFLYFLPLLFIIFVHGSIIWRLTKENDNVASDNMQESTGRVPLPLRRSDRSLMDRAKTRALKLTVTIVIVFILCWSPYMFITTWYLVDSKSAQDIHPFIQETLFIMAVANSCANPLVYGVFYSKGGTSRVVLNRAAAAAASEHGPTASQGFTTSTNLSKKSMRISKNESQLQLLERNIRVDTSGKSTFHPTACSRTRAATAPDAKATPV